MPLKDVGCVPFVALQKDVPPDRVASTSLGELAVVADQHGPLVVGVDRQLVVADSAEPGIGRGPGVVAELAEPCGQASVNVVVVHQSQRQATV